MSQKPPKLFFFSSFFLVSPFLSFFSYLLCFAFSLLHCCLVGFVWSLFFFLVLRVFMADVNEHKQTTLRYVCVFLHVISFGNALSFVKNAPFSLFLHVILFGYFIFKCKKLMECQHINLVVFILQKKKIGCFCSSPCNLIWVCLSFTESFSFFSNVSLIVSNQLFFIFHQMFVECYPQCSFPHCIF